MKEQASGFVAKGRFERAEVLYRQLLTRVPRDAQVWLKHADLNRRLMRMQAAVLSYRMAANLLLQQGHEARAVAALKSALDLRPDDIDLISDIIRVEMRRSRRRQRPFPFHDAPDAQHHEIEHTEHTEHVEHVEHVEHHEPQLALPMLPASPPPETASTDTPPEGLTLEIAATPAQRRDWPQIRRLNDLEIAIKTSADSKWLVITSTTVLQVRFTDRLELDEETPWLE